MVYITWTAKIWGLCRGGEDNVQVIARAGSGVRDPDFCHTNFALQLRHWPGHFLHHPYIGPLAAHGCVYLCVCARSVFGPANPKGRLQEILHAYLELLPPIHPDCAPIEIKLPPSWAAELEQARADRSISSSVWPTASLSGFYPAPPVWGNKARRICGCFWVVCSCQSHKNPRDCPGKGGLEGPFPRVIWGFPPFRHDLYQSKWPPWLGKSKSQPLGVLWINNAIVDPQNTHPILHPPHPPDPLPLLINLLPSLVTLGNTIPAHPLRSIAAAAPQRQVHFQSCPGSTFSPPCLKGFLFKKA